MKPTTYDFSGWATKNDLKCADGRTIKKDAFLHQDGAVVPLVWGHQSSDPFEYLGHAFLENREDGVYAYASFNETSQGQNAKELVKHGDVQWLSIHANKLKQVGGDVIHGIIREVSLVMAGANPGARIEEVLVHSDDYDGEDEEAIIHTGEKLEVFHAEEPPKETEAPSTDNETIGDVLKTLNEKQMTAVAALIDQALDHSDTSEEEPPKEDTQEKEEEGTSMKHNVFEDQDKDTKETSLKHAEEFAAIIKDAKRGYSLRDTALQHGIDNIDVLFPDAQNVTDTPAFIQRDMGWVGKVMGETHHTPFSKIKSAFANITADEARARGYIKGNYKQEEVFTLLKRTTSAQTVYKKQKLDRDDIIDIVDLNVVSWVKAEMRMMLDEELARAFLIGDGRLASSDDKIKTDCIRPIWTDEDLYTIKADVTVAADATADTKAKAFERACIKNRKDYKGSGSPVLFTTEDMLTDCLLREDGVGRKIYSSVAELATSLRVREIITVPVMENLTRTRTDATEVTLLGIIVNLVDYNVGADKGGAVSLFEDFDIDYNQEKYLIETKCSGALIRPYSAIALELVVEEAAG
jgi:HK97 family phage prohead protease